MTIIMALFGFMGVGFARMGVESGEPGLVPPVPSWLWADGGSDAILWADGGSDVIALES